MKKSPHSAAKAARDHPQERVSNKPTP